MNQHPTDDRLLDAAHGLLPEAERREVVAHCRGCGECATRLKSVAATHERAFAFAAGALGAASGFGPAAPPHRPAREGRVPGSDDPPGSVARIHRLPRSAVGRRHGTARTVAALAASFAIVSVVAYVWTGSRAVRVPREPVAWLPAPEANVLTRDSLDAAADPRVAEGLAAYRDRDAMASRRLLRSARAAGPLEQVRRIYLGNAELQLDQPRAALETLRGVDLALVPEPWQGEARWSLALAYSRTGRGRAADSRWELLSKRPDEIGERARRARAAAAPPAGAR